MQFYYSLEILRGLGALMVMLLHFNRMVEPYAENGFGSWLELSSIAVDYFFVLSGFLMYYIYKNKIGNPSEFKKYYLRRIARIYPMFWIGLIAMSLLIPLSSSMYFPEIEDIIKHVLLIKPNIDESGHGRILGVAWTLELEMIFYALFGLLILIKSKKLRLMALTCCFLLSFAQPYFLLFYFGMLLGWLKGNKSPIFSGSFGLLIASLGLAIAVFVEAQITDNLYQKIGFGVSFSIMIIGLIRTENKIDSFSKKTPKLIMSLGSSSYTLYLLHIPIGVVFLKLALLSNINNHIDAWLLVVLMASISTAFSIFISKHIEMPINKMLQTVIKKTS